MAIGAVKRPQMKPTTWKCTHPERMYLHLVAIPPDLSVPYSATVSLRQIIFRHNDRLPGRVARVQREPWAIKQVRAQLNKSPDEPTRLRLHNQLTKARWAFCEQLKKDSLKARLRKGGVASKRQSLWPLTAVKMPNGQVRTYLPQCLADAVANFAGKWQGAVEERAERWNTLRLS
jgi:hypothetical protein